MVLQNEYKDCSAKCQYTVAINWQVGGGGGGGGGGEGRGGEGGGSE